jgi:hypothetical protein
MENGLLKAGPMVRATLAVIYALECGTASLVLRLTSLSLPAASRQLRLSFPSGGFVREDLLPKTGFTLLKSFLPSSIDFRICATISAMRVRREWPNAFSHMRICRFSHLGTKSQTSDCHSLDHEAVP